MAGTTLAPSVLTEGTTGNVIQLTGTGTAWVSGTTVFSLSGGTGAAITAQTISSATAATITVTPGTATAFLIVSNNTDSSTAQVFAEPSWYAVSSYVPSGGPVGSVASGLTLQGGWIDNYGGVWSINSSNQLINNTAINGALYGLLLRPVGENPSDYNAQASAVFQPVNISTSPITNFFAFRCLNGGTSANEYSAGLTFTSTLVAGAFFRTINGASTQIGSTVNMATSLSAASTYRITASCVQLNSTTTVLTMQLFNSSGTLLNTWFVSDTTASVLQNATGQTGVFGNQSPGYFTSLTTYSDIAPVAATGYSLTLAQSTGQANVPVMVTVNLTGGTTLTSALVVTPSDSLTNSSFVGVPATIPSGSISTTFLVYPSLAGSHSISAAHSGGNSGMSDASPAVYTATASGPVVLPSSSAACVLSPTNWSPSTNFTGGMQSWCTGAYARFVVNNCASGVTLLFDPASTAFYTYQIDNNVLALSTPGSAVNGALGLTVPANGVVNITIPDAGQHTIRVRMFSIPYNGRWTRTGFLGIISLLLPVGGTVVAAAPNSKNIFMYGDSLLEGTLANNGIDGQPYDYGYMVGEALYDAGFEWASIACGNQGFGVAGVGSVPSLVNSWNKIDTTYSRVTGGLFTTQPDIIYMNMGANDYLHGTPGAPLQALIVQQLGSFKAAAPKVFIVMCVPLGGYARSDVEAAFATYQANYVISTGANDPSVILIDLYIDPRISSTAPGAYALTDGNHLHMGIWGHSNAGPQIAQMIQAGYDNYITPPNRWLH